MFINRLVFDGYKNMEIAEENRKSFCVNKTVIEVGSCDLFRYCKVKLSSEEFTYMKQPMIGETCK